MMKSTIPLQFFVVALVVLVLFTALAFAVGSIGSASVKDRFLKTQQLLARAQASNIQMFFEDFGTSVRILAQSPSVKYRNAATVEKMDTWVGEWADSGLVGGVVLTDARGIVRFNSNALGTRDVGVSLADRDYFVWASEQESDGEYMVGTPVISRLGASKDEQIVVVASPVFTNDVFAGVIATSVDLKALTERYVNLMKISDTTLVYVMSRSGDLLYGKANTNEGMLLTDVAEDILSTGTEGAIETRGYMVSYAEIPLVNEQWWLVMVSSAREMRNLVQTIYVRQMILLPIVFVSLLIVWLSAQKRLW